MKLTDEQQFVVTKAVDHVDKGHGVFKIGGVAGTGKTTCAMKIAAILPGAMACSFTGKAAHRLRQVGLTSAITIHRTIYKYDHALSKFVLKCRDELEGCYFLVDEGSMVGRELWQDVYRFGCPIVVLGDPAQLEPVKERDIYLMRDPSVQLRRIHRQAQQSGIIQFATGIRLRKNYRSEYRDVTIARGQITSEDMLWGGIIICGFNRTRVAINKSVRSLLKRRAPICRGDKLICLENNYTYGVFNGQSLEVVKTEKVFNSQRVVRCLVKDQGSTRSLPIRMEAFNGGEKPPYSPNMGIVADYGYCVTCHKAQGSEWDRVVVVDEQHPKLWDATRWRYTAVTRSAKELKYYTHF